MAIGAVHDARVPIPAVSAEAVVEHLSVTLAELRIACFSAPVRLISKPFEPPASGWVNSTGIYQQVPNVPSLNPAEKAIAR